jgi:hypothetical protein
MMGEREITRGVLYLNALERKAWERVYGIAHEGDRSEKDARDLLTQAMRLALEHRGWA